MLLHGKEINVSKIWNYIERIIYSSLLISYLNAIWWNCRYYVCTALNVNCTYLLTTGRMYCRYCSERFLDMSDFWIISMTFLEGLKLDVSFFVKICWIIEYYRFKLPVLIGISFFVFDRPKNNVVFYSLMKDRIFGIFQILKFYEHPAFPHMI